MMDGTISKGTKGNLRKKSGGPFSFVSPLSKSGLYYYRNPTSYLQLAAEEVGIPLTVKILEGDLTAELQHGTILTMHKILEIVKLKCVKSNGDCFELPVELESCVETIGVQNEKCYDSVGDVLTNQRSDKIDWITVTKPFVYQGNVYNPGTIFEVLPVDDVENDYLSLEVYPGRLMVFLPTNICGRFYKIHSPFNVKKQKLPELKQENTPMLIIPKLKTFPNNFIESTNLTNDRILVVEKKLEKFVLASSFKNDDFYIHFFPLVVEVSCEILLGGIPVDIVRQKEISKIEKKLLPMLHHAIDYAISMPYKTAGIERSKSTKSRAMKLKKKDITLPEILVDNEYSRYIAKPTSLMRELGQTINGHANEAPTLVRMNTIAQRPKVNNNNNEERSRNRESIAGILKKVDLEKYKEIFFNEQLDCKLLTRFDENDFLEFGLTMDEVHRFYTSIHDKSVGEKSESETEKLKDSDGEDERDGESDNSVCSSTSTEIDRHNSTATESDVESTTASETSALEAIESVVFNI